MPKFATPKRSPETFLGPNQHRGREASWRPRKLPEAPFAKKEIADLDRFDLQCALLGNPVFLGCGQH